MGDNDIDELEMLLEQAGNNEKKKIITPKDRIPKTIPMTEGAYKKADMIGPIIKKLSKSDYEWSAFLLAQKDDPKYIVRDIHIQKDQDITYGNVKLKGEDVAKASVEIQKRNKEKGTNLYVIGWIHGHGLGMLSPSGVDKNNFKVVLNSVSLNTEQHLSVPLNLIETNVTKRKEDGKIIYSGSAVEDAVIEYALSNDKLLEKILQEQDIDPEKVNILKKGNLLLESLLDATKINYYQSNIFGFSYFVIMNNKHSKEYASIGLTAEKAITKTDSAEIVEGLEISKVHVENDIEFTEKSLKAELKSRIHIPKPTIYNIEGLNLFNKIKSGKKKKVKKGKKRVSVVAGDYNKHQTGLLPKGSTHQQHETSNRTHYYNVLYVGSMALKTIEDNIIKYESLGAKGKMSELKEFMNMIQEIDYVVGFNAKEEIINSYFENKYSMQKNLSLDKKKDVKKDGK